MKQMRTDIIKLTAAALYGDKTQKIVGMKLDEDFYNPKARPPPHV